jgi:hypothetical protein
MDATAEEASLIQPALAAAAEKAALAAVTRMEAAEAATAAAKAEVNPTPPIVLLAQPEPGLRRNRGWGALKARTIGQRKATHETRHLLPHRVRCLRHGRRPWRTWQRRPATKRCVS